MPLAPGTRLGPYELEAPLGAGGMGVVYQARDTRLDRAVAIKVLPPDFADDPDRRQRFEREARTISKLSHPNICALFDVGEHDGQPFLVMEVIRGVTVQQRLTGTPFKASEVLELGAQLADALDAAHAEQIIHRDIKPANVFVTDRGQAKLLDFGLAKLAPDQRARTETGDAFGARTLQDDQLTMPGSAVGTVAYMSPEQARGEMLDHRTDVFSLGAVLYEMVVGRQAFSGATTAVIFEAILNRPPLPLAHANLDVPPRLQEIISNALEKDRELRYQNAADLRADLKRAKRDLDSGQSGLASRLSRDVAPPAPPPPPEMVGDSQWVSLSSPSLSETRAEPDPSVSTKKRLLAALLCVPPLGLFGAHRFYVGRVTSGILQLLTIGGLVFWTLADMLVIVFGEFSDRDGKKIKNWV